MNIKTFYIYLTLVVSCLNCMDANNVTLTIKNSTNTVWQSVTIFHGSEVYASQNQIPNDASAEFVNIPTEDLTDIPFTTEHRLCGPVSIQIIPYTTNTLSIPSFKILFNGNTEIEISSFNGIFGIQRRFIVTNNSEGDIFIITNGPFEKYNPQGKIYPHNRQFFILYPEQSEALNIFIPLEHAQEFNVVGKCVYLDTGKSFELIAPSLMYGDHFDQTIQ
ncbi:MAG: hypothetical protein US49_C0002G0008 [candidate division TM6 bacterium GW2011_GWF2_37_49]|nr:MAG: hypothetical protein US49_C0002G0008 [candidate division TM6 bacterium GW2011_GWF2_37_49]